MTRDDEFPRVLNSQALLCEFKTSAHGESRRRENHRIERVKELLLEHSRDIDRCCLQEAAAAPPLDPVDVILLPAHDPELELARDFHTAPDQRIHLLWRILDQFQVRSEQLQDPQNVGVFLLMLLKKGLMGPETRTAFRLSK